ncbi:MAG: transposase [Spirochaetes bacterium]|nr:transposase [Spirochaetota bacterium]
MGRKRRELIDGASYHVTARTNNRLYYLHRNECKRLFLQILRKTQKKYRCRIEGFSIMNNHIHLIIKPSQIYDLPKIMHKLLMTFAKRFNKRFKQTGHVWESRYFSRILISIWEVGQALIYVLNNPVKAQLVVNPKEWRWSSIFFYKKKINFFMQWISNEMHTFYQQYC